MPTVVESWRQLKEVVDTAWAERRVTPPAPPRRKPRPARAGEEAGSKRRGKAAGWSVYLCYRDGDGYESERRVTCLNLSRQVGGYLTLGSFCHEAEGYRDFRADRITELVDVATGEIVPPVPYLERLRAEGLPFGDRGLEALAKILVFMMRCDGVEDPREWEAIERALASYALRFDATDVEFEQALRGARGLAPDATDFSLALRRVLRSPSDVRRPVADLCARACASVIDADGRICSDEMHWGAAVDRCLSIIRG
jgi:hypothetical protein